jgi:competence protein ComEA
VRLDINRATAAELESLPGIGPVLAGRIVQDREANGPFSSVDELDRVEGIGKGIVAKVRDHVTVGP